jgi:hypothetical protein
MPDAQRIDEIVPKEGLEEVAAAVDLDISAILRFELLDVLDNVPLEHVGVVPGNSSVREATYFGRVLRAVAFSSAGSVALGQEAANIS